MNEGKGASAIAKDLKTKGIKVKRPRKKENSTDWRNGTILDILKNVKYVGDLKQRITYTVDYLEHIKKQNEGEVEFIYTRNHHEPIIDRETFEATQRELERRSNLHKREKSKYTNKHTFSGKLVCGCCKASYVGGVHKERKDGTQLRTWRCYTAVAYGKKHIVNGQEIGCDNDRVNDEVLKIGFTKALAEIVDNKEEIQKEMETILKDVLKKCDSEIQVGERLLKEKEQLNKDKRKLLDLCIKEVISEQDFKIKNEELEEEIKRVDKEIKQQEDKQMLRDNIEDILDNARKVIDKILDIKEFSKTVCRELVDKIIIYNKKKFDYYIKGYKNPYLFDYEGNILYLQHLVLVQNVYNLSKDVQSEVRVDHLRNFYKDVEIRILLNLL